MVSNNDKPKQTKKRKPKSKNKSQTFKKNPEPITPPTIEHEFNYKSPRKEAIMRYKQSNDEKPNNLRNNLKSKPKQIDHINPDEKVTLFKYNSLKILELNNNNSPGSLLAHGEFEIFQLHKGDVTYLSCGSQFIYPLLPKIKIFKINTNQFLLPLVNPERYWKIFINSEEDNVLNNLQFTLERIVQFMNLQEEKLTFEIPESPPSAPISPQHINFELNKKPSLQSLSTNIACLDLNHPKPKHSNPFRYIPIDEKSESSMDSLLDEFEVRPVSQRSIPNKVPNYSRGNYFHGKDEDLSRSRRSSRSELYNSESGWMEPNQPQFRRLPKSRSNYSINSTQSYDLNNIYKSVIRNNDTKSIRSMSRLPTISANVQSDFTQRNSIYKREDVKLNSNEIYKLLSSKPQPKKVQVLLRDYLVGS